MTVWLQKLSEPFREKIKELECCTVEAPVTNIGLQKFREKEGTFINYS